LDCPLELESGACHSNEVRSIRPNHEFPEDLPGLGKDIGKVSTVKEVELLYRLGRPGWTELPEILEDVLQSMSL
jgi:hypothetical protein